MHSFVFVSAKFQPILARFTKNLGPVHTNPFSFENAYFFIRFYRSSTLKRSKTEMFIYENGGFRKRFPEWRLLKTQVYRISVDGKNGGFQKRLRHNSLCQPQFPALARKQTSIQYGGRACVYGNSR